jgi:hypothetical protein
MQAAPWSAIGGAKAAQALPLPNQIDKWRLPFHAGSWPGIAHQLWLPSGSAGRSLHAVGQPQRQPGEHQQNRDGDQVRDDVRQNADEHVGHGRVRIFGHDECVQRRPTVPSAPLELPVVPSHKLWPSPWSSPSAVSATYGGPRASEWLKLGCCTRQAIGFPMPVHWSETISADR